MGDHSSMKTMARATREVGRLAATLAAIVALFTAGAAHKQYTVQPGDTLDAIAQRHGTTVSVLMGENDLTDPGRIAVGTILSIPDGSGTTHHVIRPGQTLSTIAQRYGVFNWKASATEKRRVTQTWVHGELISISGATSLEALGLVAFDLRRPPGVAIPEPLLALGMEEDEAWTLVRELLRSVRSQGAVTFPDGVAPDDEVFEPRTGPIYVRLEGPEARRKVISWLPGRGQNGRLDYLGRVLLRLGADVPPIELARNIWRWLTEAFPPDRQLLHALNPKGLGVVHALNHELVTTRAVSTCMSRGIRASRIPRASELTRGWTGCSVRPTQAPSSGASDKEG